MTEVRYWDSRHGFWRVGELVEQGQKFATIQPLGPGARKIQVPVSDIEPLKKAGQK